MSTRAGWGFVTDDVRASFARYLVGTGIELGPGHHPYVITLPETTVHFVDRWEPEENRALFPELGEGAEFPKPDIVANLDDERLAMLDDASQDFVIASHVFEHVANPLALLLDCHRVLTPGGTMILLLPDMRRTSDRRRTPTSLDHLLDELNRDIRAVDETHKREYAYDVQGFSGDDEALAAHLDLLSRRSFHVHSWTEEHFFPVLEHLAGQLGAPFELLDLLLTEDFAGSKEFGYVLRRASADLEPKLVAGRLVAQREFLGRVRYSAPRPATVSTAPAPPRPADLERTIAGLQRTVAAQQRRLARYDSYFDRIRNSPAYPLIAAVRRAARRRGR